jgi:AbiV family abortive infection protein
MAVTPQYILQGSVYALQQCGLLLRGASILYRNGAHANAVVLTLFAQEELGQSHLLDDLWRKASAGDTLTMEQIRDACKDHVAKQEAGMVSLTMRADNNSGLGKILKATHTNPPQSPEGQKARSELKKIDNQKIKRTPGDRHAKRMAALYVDPVTETRWNVPNETSASEAETLLQDAINDYSGRYHNCYLPPGGSNEILKAVDPELYNALAQWPDRPELELPNEVRAAAAPAPMSAATATA